MKQKMLYLPDEIVEKLSKINASKVVSDLLLSYFSGVSSFNKEELIRKKLELANVINEKTEEYNLILEQLEKVKQEEKKLQEMFRGVPKEIIDDFKIFPNMTEEILESRIREIYSHNYPDMNYKLIWDAYKEYFKKRENENIPIQTE